MILNPRHKMPYFVGLLLAIILALGWVGSYSVNKVADLTEELYDHPLVVSTAVLRINNNVLLMHRAMKDIVLSDSMESAYHYRSIVTQTEDKILADFNLVEERFLGNIELVHTARRAFLDWKPIRDEVITLTLQGKHKEAATITQTIGAEKVDEIEAKISELRDYARNKSREFLANAKETRAKTLWFVWLSLLGSLILAVFAFYMAVRIESNLQELNEELDSKVRLRTAELEIANENLSAQYEEITAMNEELTAQNEQITAQNEEITAQGEEVRAQYEEITAQNEELTAQNEEINSLNVELENRVNERTADLTAANQELAAQFDDLSRAQDKLRASEENFRTFFDSVSEGVALHELVYNDGEVVDYRVTRTNPSYESHTGLSAEKVQGRLATEIYSTAEPPYLKEYTHVAQTGQSRVFETYFPPMDKHFRISVVSPFRGQFATIFEDISERVKREAELQQKNEEISRFVYTVSHDLRSPLVTIKTFLGYLEQDSKEQDVAAVDKDMGYIRNAADKMAILLDELLKLSRIGSKMNAPAEISLQALTSEVLDLVAGRIVNRGVRIVVTKEPIVLFGDLSRLKELFQNLIDNAVKFIGSQPDPLIEIGALQDNTGITLFVRDNGCGIDPRHKKKLFGLFEKLDQKTEGAGMGLAIAKRVAELHGGTIWVESDGIGTGATFYFKLPRTRLATSEGGK